MQNRHKGRIHFSIQRTAAECDWRGAKLNEVSHRTWFVPKVHSADGRFCHNWIGPSLCLQGCTGVTRC